MTFFVIALLAQMNSRAVVYRFIREFIKEVDKKKNRTGGETSGSEGKRCDAVDWGLIKRGDFKLLIHSNLDF